MGQFIRKNGPTTHETKRGTPTMGGVVIILSTLCGWLIAALFEMRIPRASVWILVFLFVGLGVIGFLDDYIKISKQRSFWVLNLAVKLSVSLQSVLFFRFGFKFPQ